MRSRKKKSMEQLTSTLLALMMAVTTTMSPVITLASELESSMAAVESQIEETTAEESTAEPSTVVVQSETAVQAQTDTETTALQAVSSDEASEVETKTDASTEAETVSTEEATYNEEETTTLPESDPSGEESTEESKANETRGPDESETAQTPETSGTSLVPLPKKLPMQRLPKLLIQPQRFRQLSCPMRQPKKKSFLTSRQLVETKVMPSMSLLEVWIQTCISWYGWLSMEQKKIS